MYLCRGRVTARWPYLGVLKDSIIHIRDTSISGTGLADRAFTHMVLPIALGAAVAASAAVLKAKCTFFVGANG